LPSLLSCSSTQFAHAACQSRFRAFGPFAACQWFLKLSKARRPQSIPRRSMISRAIVSGPNLIGLQSSGRRVPVASRFVRDEEGVAF
jgi:hypothetical protein